MAAYGDSTAATGTGSAVVTKPSGLAAGDLLVAIVADNGASGSLTTPTDWTSIVTDTNLDGYHIAVFAKVADASDASATDFTFAHSNGAALMAAHLFRITGTLAGTGCIYASVAEDGTEPSADVFRFPTGVTPYVASSLLILAGHFGSVGDNLDDSSITAWAVETSNPTWTEREQTLYGTGGNGHRLGTATATRTETTATGYAQITVTIAGGEDAGRSHGVLLAITDSTNGSVSPAVITTAIGIQTPTPTGGASVTVSDPLTLTSSIQAPTAAAGESLWKNTDKPSAGSITNVNKP